jgi:imidazole glycerol-phosphate synthase subunit HisF
MLTKRIIPCLDIKEGRTVKGVNFVELRDAGDPVELAKIYSDEGADELVFLDITATVDKRKTLAELVTKIAKAINIPFTVGGGISTIEDVKVLAQCGADKISINSAAVHNPQIINDMAGIWQSVCRGSNRYPECRRNRFCPYPWWKKTHAYFKPKLGQRKSVTVVQVKSC